MNGRRRLFLFFFVSVLSLAAVSALQAGGAYSQPPPDLGSDYAYPHSNQAPTRAGWIMWLDTAVLLVLLCLASLFAIRVRSRRAMFYLSIAALAYLGFWRRGCVCPVGAVQNVAQAAFDVTFVVPWVVLAFFALPLAFSIVFGRVFCAGVCPIGALQDLVLLRPVRVPRGLDEGLGLLRHFYLGLAVLFAATGSTYLICTYDPMVAFFRMAGPFHIWVWSVGVLILAMFVGRPYCRYLCPYGALLGLVARFSVRRATVTPAECVVCGLCRDACPFGAIREAREAED